MPTLQTEFLGLTFPNPFLLAAGPPTARAHMVIDAFDAGWGGAVLKTISIDPTAYPSPRVHVVKTRGRKSGMLDIELFSPRTVDEWSRDLDLIRDSYPDRPVIASIAGGGNPADWNDVISSLEPHGVSGYEMNVSCPNFSEGDRGERLGQDPESLALAVGWVREATDLPVIVKLTPNVTDIVALARVAAEAGADGFTTVNSLSGLGGIDLETFEPMPAVKGVGTYGGYGGPGLKPVALRCTADVAANVGVPVVGCGGVSEWQDAAEYLAVGASLVQVCTAAMWYGHRVLDRLSTGLMRYLEEHGYEAPAQIVGKALPNIRSYSDLDLTAENVAVLDAELCNGCGICVRACETGGFQAIAMADDVACIDRAKCDGCGLCVGVCPRGALSLTAVEG